MTGRQRRSTKATSADEIGLFEQLGVRDLTTMTCRVTPFPMRNKSSPIPVWLPVGPFPWHYRLHRKGGRRRKTSLEHFQGRATPCSYTENTLWPWAALPEHPDHYPGPSALRPPTGRAHRAGCAHDQQMWCVGGFSTDGGRHSAPRPPRPSRIASGKTAWRGRLVGLRTWRPGNEDSAPLGRGPPPRAAAWICGPGHLAEGPGEPTAARWRWGFHPQRVAPSSQTIAGWSISGGLGDDGRALIAVPDSAVGPPGTP
jgi:hypothetical protein